MFLFTSTQTADYFDFLDDQYSYQILPEADKDWRTNINKEPKHMDKSIDLAITNLDKEIKKLDKEMSKLGKKKQILTAASDQLKLASNKEFLASK